MHFLSTSYLIWEGGKQLLHFTSEGWTPLHLSFFYSRKWSNDMWATSDINYLSKQWTHFAFGPCWHNHFAVTVWSFKSTWVQFRHFPPGPWLHFGLSSFFYYFFYYPPRQFKHFPPGGWLHFEFKVYFLNKDNFT